MPNFEGSVLRSIPWSIVSKAAVRSNNNATQQLLSEDRNVILYMKQSSFTVSHSVYMQIEMAQIDYSSGDRL